MAEERVRRVEVEGRPAWRKHYSPQGRRLRMALLRWLARRLGANALLAPIPLSPERACRTEQAMIARLAALGARVPAVLEAGPDHLVLSDLGPTLSAACRRERDPGRREALVATGFAALLDLHRRGGYLSQAFARNLTLAGDGAVGFIDLEEDPLGMMPLDAAQARDVLFYVHSTARFLAGEPGRYRALLDAHLAAEPEAVRREVRRTARRLAWLAPLARPFGARARAVAQALRALAASAA